MLDYDVIIIGAGSAGLSAAIYTARARLNTLVVEQLMPGGQIAVASEVENYPGFPDGILGPELAQLLEAQATKFGAQIESDQIQSIYKTGETHVVQGDTSQYSARSLIIASGGEHTLLGVPGESELSGRGVSYCATCDGNFFSGEDTLVVGGGDAAIDEGLYLSRIASKVTVIHRRDKLRASKILQERAFNTPNMDFKWNHVVREIHGNGSVSGVLLENTESGKIYEYPGSAVFIYIGFHPSTGYLRNQVSMDPAGHIITNVRMETNVSGIFACGDVRQFSDKQLATAAGDGVTAAMSAYRFLS